MASTSASSVQKIFKYDVFLSFRGEDTRSNFVDHLYDALHKIGIITYKDDETIEKGEKISEQLIRSIEESRFYIIVFSNNYASSSWCLDELVKIMECQKTNEQTAYPVFYHVEPTEIRNQSGAVEKAFAKHVENEAADKWRGALKEACDLAGWHLKPDGRQAEFIQKLVKEISIKLHFINLSIDKKLVGMETRVETVIQSLQIDSEDGVRMIGIKGIGGGGKTTLARAVFDHISIWFDGKSFVENVREGSKGFGGLKELQKQVLAAVLNDITIDVTGVYDGKNMMKKMMPSTKALIVLDDVDDMGQLEALAGEPNWFKPGSRIIITTRDEQLLVAHGVYSDNIHDINLLSDEEAICLFSRYAFGREIPNEGYEELSENIVHYAGGLPLTIKVLGSFLCGRLESEWEDAIERLKTIPLKETLEKLELSYNGLENDQKEIFLEIACILKGEEKDVAIRILESCGFRAQICFRVLEQKSLITISHDDRLLMHDHIEEMGMNIVRRLYPDEPNKHSRLWVTKEIEDILVNDLGTKATRSIKLKFLGIHPVIIMKSLRKMEELRLLYCTGLSTKYKIDEGGQYLPNTLRSLHWPEYPFCCLPTTFQANNLVNLVMPWSYISQLWEGGEKKVLKKLRFVVLHFSNLRTFDLGMTPNLETLDLHACYKFVKLQMPIECPKLRFVNLSVSKVSKLNLGMTPNIKELYLEGCEDFLQLQMPVELQMLKKLKLSYSNVSKLNLGMTPNIKELYLESCKYLVELQMSVELPKLHKLNLSQSNVSKLNLGMTSNIKKLYLERCEDFLELQMPVELQMLKKLNLSYSKVSKLNLGMTPNIEELDLERCEDFLELQMPVELQMLKKLNLSYSKVSKLNLGMTPNIKELYLEGCEDFLELQMPVELQMLKNLNLSYSKVSKLNLGMTPNIEELDLERCKYLVELQMSIELPKLNELDLSHSKVSKLNLGMIPHLQSLQLRKCYYLQEIHAPVGCLNKLTSLKLSGCSRFEYFSVGRQYKLRGLDSVAMLELIAESLDICPLHPNSNLSKFQFKCKYDEALISSSGNLEKLISFGLCACTNLESFSASICSLKHLRVLRLEGSIPEVPMDLGQLGSLEKLYLSSKEIKHLPDSICMMKHMKSLDLKSCWLLEQLPMDLGRLECLEELHLRDCISLQDIPNSICKMKCLKYLDLGFCFLVEKLPEELGRVECLKLLNIEGAGISRLPESIFQLKDLGIIGSAWRLESYGFISLTEISTNTASCYIGNYFDLSFEVVEHE